MSRVMGSPETTWRSGRNAVKSGLICSQVIPPSVVLCTYWEPWKTTSESWGDTSMGTTLWNR
jgi:hypothetical protein